MTISHVIEPSRKSVIWTDGRVPEDVDSVFKKRGYFVSECPVRDLDLSNLGGVGAVVFRFDHQQTERSKRELEFIASSLLSHGCRLFVIAAVVHANAMRSFAARLNLPIWWPGDREVAPLPHIHVVDVATYLEDIADLIALRPADEAPDVDLVIEPKSQFSGEREILIRRAFSGFSEAHFSPITDGRSGADVYIVRGKKRGEIYGWAQPYFVKLGPRDKILCEYNSYENGVSPFIPFHLGPSLDKERCHLGHECGILVGGYVEGSESLGECASDERAAHAIACLFDKTLRAWYRNGKIEDRSLLSQRRRLPDEYPNGRLDLANEMGIVVSVESIADLFARARSSPWFTGYVHGDLHCSNVRVRATDAIVIDFFAHRSAGLILLDIARLEASLLVNRFGGEPFENPGEPEDFRGAEWLGVIRESYRGDPMANIPHHFEDPKSPVYWFHGCIRQIRLHARPYECARGQYAAALALQLLWMSAKDGEVKGFENYRRAAAIHIAACLLQAVFPPVETENDATEQA